MKRYYNDGTATQPKLRVFMNMDNLTDLVPGTLWGGETGEFMDHRLKADGFDGIQITSLPETPAETTLPFCGLGRVNAPEEAGPLAEKHAARGDLCLTVHVGWGLEDDDQVFRLVESILRASEQHALPIFIETHRATITQDLWRTVRIVREFPEVLLNGDFSHYYCGQELVYGDWQSKMAFMEPIFSRIAFMHGRIASPGCMQVPLGPDFSTRPQQAHGVTDYLEHFRDLWTRAMSGFLASAGPGDVLVFAPELLSGAHYYARMFPDASGTLVEESDRYAQALLCAELARSCFAKAGEANAKSRKVL